MNKFEELLVNKGLYDSIDITIDDLDEMQNLLSSEIYGKYNIDCFCINCNEKRIFECVDKRIYIEDALIRMAANQDNHNREVPKLETIFQGYLNKRYSISFQCTRDQAHSLLFDLLITNNKMIKIGQYPSFADISIEDKGKYRSVLKDKYREYNRALGLFANGIGIGSFVYLRRIIESLVFDKFKEVSSTIGVDEGTFTKSRFEEKITILNDYLPKVLVSNKNIYGIVSKGIHELGEEECMEMFPYIKAGIELILDDILAEKERKEKEKVFNNFIANKTRELRNN